MSRREWRAAFSAALVFASSAPATAKDDVAIFTAAQPLPAPVRAVVTCDVVAPGEGTRRPFAGGYIFAAQCPGNNANWIQALVFSAAETGEGARLLTFPVPRGRRGGVPLDSVSNAEFDHSRREIRELFVDPEHRICRTEARWRLREPSRPPRLVFWRETADCAGKRGWRVLLRRPG